MSGGFDELLRELDDDQVGDDESGWGERRALDVGETLAGFWRGQDEWQGEYGPAAVYLMTDADGVEFHFFGGRKQLDRRLADAAPNVGDRVAVRRLEDAPTEGDRSPAWRVKVAVRRGDGTIPVARTVDDAGKAGDDDIPF